jgi:hypothetical protein
MALRDSTTFIDEVRSFEATDAEDFDRVDFAIQALRTLRPPRLTVAVYRRHSGIRVDSVRDLRGGEGARWAMIGVPPRASRAQIAHAIAELAGVSSLPYGIDVMLGAGTARS